MVITKVALVLFEVLVFIARIQIHTSDAFQYLALGLCPESASVGLVEVVLKKEKEEKKIARNTAIAPQSMYYPPLILAGAPKRVLVTSGTQWTAGRRSRSILEFERTDK